MRSWNVTDGARASQSVRGGFTLIEILIVVAIIALIAAASLVALGGARGFFSNVTLKMQLDDVSRALELYKQKHGEYPPDCCATPAEVRRHILKRWPKVLKTGSVDKMVDFALAEMQRSPGSVALFWLAGPRDVTPDGPVYDGFLSDVMNPFGLKSPCPDDPEDMRMAYDDIKDEPCEEPLIELKYHSEEMGDGNYDDEGLCFAGQTLAYFRAEGTTAGYAGKCFHWYIRNEVTGEIEKDFGFAAPYMKNGAWYKADSFQLILFGADENYGFDHHEEGVRDIALANKDQNTADQWVNDWDNVTNFTNGATLDSERD